MAIGIDYNSGIPHTDGAPVHDPGTNGGKVAYDYVARVLYKHVTGATWEVLATGGGGGTDGNGIYDGSGTVPDGTEATLSGELSFVDTNGSAFGWKQDYWSPSLAGPFSGFGLGVGDPTAASDYAMMYMPTDQFSFNYEGASGLGGANLNISPGSVVFYEYSGAENSQFAANGGVFNISASTQTTMAAPIFNIIGNVFLLDASNNGAFYPHQLTTTQRDAMTGIVEGATIYNLTIHKLQVYDGTTWQSAW